MSDPVRMTIARTMASVAVVAAVVGIVWLVVIGFTDELWEDWVFHNGIIAVGSGVIAWIVAPSQPRNGEIWVFAWAGLFTGLLCLTYAAGASLLNPAGPGLSVLDVVPAEQPLAAGVFLMFANFLWVGVFFPLTLGLALFPDGRPPSPRWRWLVYVLITVLGLLCLALFWLANPASTLTLSQTQDTNGGFTGLAAVVTVSYVAVFAVIPLCVTALVIRFRRSAGIERQQFRWVVWASAIAGLLMVSAVVMDEAADRLDVALVLGAIAMIVLLTSFGFAIGRYRLYDVDVVINRTVVLGVLAAFITSVYAAVVVGIGSIVGGTSGLALPIAATAVVAGAFEPVRHVAQRWANRLVYGRRASPYEVLADLTERLAAAESEEGVLDRMAMLLRDGTGAERATVWLGAADRLRLGASAPPDVPVAATTSSDELDGDAFPVHHSGRMVGMLEVVTRRGSILTPTERDLVLDLAGSAGLVLGHQRLNESLAMRARELAESRMRLVEAQDTERRRLERALHDGAQQQIVALKVQLGVAAKLASGHDDLVRLLVDLGNEAQAALEDVRSLAKGIYPPLLVSDGLRAAIAGLAGSAPVEVSVHGDGIGRYRPDVEAAVYFNVSEAITNAVKHAIPPIRVALSDDGAWLHFEVTDSGPGFDPATVNGSSGLRNMADRVDAVGGDVEFESRRGVGTTIRGTVPVGERAGERR
ncbi:MAG TPA: ATP-binding protein [Acidimicrobiia bacterium]